MGTPTGSEHTVDRRHRYFHTAYLAVQVSNVQMQHAHACNPPLPDVRIADSGWYTPESVDMMLKMCGWLPDIHIMKHRKPMLLKAPVALPTIACGRPTGLHCR